MTRVMQFLRSRRANLVSHVARRVATLLVVALLGASAASPHQDMLIKLGPDGQLQGLPSRYQPARLLLAGGRVAAPNLPVDTRLTVLQIRDRRLEFPACLSVLFAKATRGMVLSASWYHDTKFLPPYLSIDLRTNGPTNGGYYDGWHILVDIEKLKVIKVEANVTEGEKGSRSLEIDIPKFCGTAEAMGK